MKVLIVGGGGREHAIADAIRRSSRKPEIFCAPGNAGTACIARNLPILADNIEGLLSFAKDNGIDLTVVGPEIPLCAGIVDRFQDAGLRIFGPCAAAARLEGDKAWAKDLLVEARIPTARSKTFTRIHQAKDYIIARNSAQVIKASGLAAGKGVVVCENAVDAIAAAKRMLLDKEFGDAGKCIVVEDKLIGEELSIHALIDGDTVYILESSQDHKRAHDGDTGPNTGGMGAYSPAPIATEAVYKMVESDVLVPILDILRRHEIPFKGVLYVGLMITAGGPKVLEFNCRFGDPETQVILPRLKTDILDVFDAVIDGKLCDITLDWDPRPAVCVVLASAGYPGKYEKGIPITGLDAAAACDDAVVYHAGTRSRGDTVLTEGGRVLGVTGLGTTIQEACEAAYRCAGQIDFEGKSNRSDIAHRAL